jgi:hypothetical protein
LCKERRMRRHRTAILVAAALMVACALPPATPAQTVSSTGVDTRAFGYSPADVGFRGTDAFGLPLVPGDGRYGAAYAGPGSYATCGGSVSAFLFMFGSAPGRFNYGWYSSPWDARYSGNWLSPWPPAYGFWAHHYGFGYGSPGGSYAWNPWSPWSSYRSHCGRRFGGYGFSYWGAGGSYFPIGPNWGTPYGPEWGWDYYPGSWRSFTSAGPPRYVDRSPSRAKPPVTPRTDPGRSASLGGERPGTRVIESRPETGGADLRNVDPRRRTVALEDLAATPPVEARSQDRAVNDLPPSETITDAIKRARARAATRRTEVVKIPLNPVDPARERPRQAGSTTTQAPQRVQPRSNPGTMPRSPVARPSAAQPKATQPRATQTRPRATPRVFQRPTPSARRSPEPRRAPPPPSKADSKSRTRQ